jgi:transcriptional regulator with XRE-family HTH domain
MGRQPRPKPRRLGKKLKAIREQKLGLSQTQMCAALKLKIGYSAISQYEQDKREPPLPVLLKYARLSGVSVEAIIDDKMNLPD